jgi:hypothetical protein
MNYFRIVAENEVFIDHAEGVCTDTIKSRVDNKRDELIKVTPYQ